MADAKHTLQHALLLAVTALFWTIQPTLSAYRSYIPNGKYPELPYDLSTWPGRVDDLNQPHNCFDYDMITNNRNWKSVCRLDSDGDGKSNGFELGDPQCVWNRTMTINPYRALSHPGVCEPKDSTICKDIANNPIDCATRRDTTRETTTVKTLSKQEDSNMKFLIIGVLGGLLVLVLVVIAIAVCYNKS